MKTMTTEPISLQTRESSSSQLPEFGRWQDVQRLFGIKRGTLYNLLNEGKVKSVCLRRRGNVHGCRLFYLSSINQYLQGLMDEQTSNKTN